MIHGLLAAEVILLLRVPARRPLLHDPPLPRGFPKLGGDGNSGTRMSMTVATNGTTPSARRLTRRRIKKNANAVNTEEYDPAYDETDLADIPEEEIDYGEGTENPTAEGTEDPEWVTDDLEELLTEAAQALTVTSKKLAGLAQARGYYKPDVAKGKGKGKKGSSSPPKGKGKGQGKPGAKSSGKGRGTKGKGKFDSQSALQQQRLQGSLCLGCGSPDHWSRDCPTFNVQNAQLASASIPGLCLDADGAVDTHTTWVTSCVSETSNEAKPSGKQVHFKLPPLQEFEPKVHRAPSVLLQYCEGQCSAYIIADTGCQRQVAGKAWHDQKVREIHPLWRLEFPDQCKFSFGPSTPVSSVGRYVYPAAIAGVSFSLSGECGRCQGPSTTFTKSF
eukprot:s12221_g1.t1